jgi:hypothetical protein
METAVLVNTTDRRAEVQIWFPFCIIQWDIELEHCFEWNEVLCILTDRLLLAGNICHVVHS